MNTQTLMDILKEAQDSNGGTPLDVYIVTYGDEYEIMNVNKEDCDGTGEHVYINVE